MILPNAANQCPACLAREVNLQGILQAGPGGSAYTTVHQCRKCRRYARTEKNYVAVEPESPELLELCLKKIPALNSTHQDPRIHLSDARWVWTEPHSMRFRMHLTALAEVRQVKVQQRVVVEMRVQFKMCPDCDREYTNRTWQAVVQLRQKRHDGRAPKRGLAALEMALAKNGAVRRHVLKIDNYRDGFDFFFLSLPHALAFSSYLQRVAPMRCRTSKKLVSTDSKNNTANVKHTVACDLVPLCRDDLVLVDRQAPKCKLSGRLVLVTKVSSVLHLMDASPPRRFDKDGAGADGGGFDLKAACQMELSPEPYYRSEKMYKVVQSSNRLTRFVVLDVELCGGGGGRGNNSGEGDGDDASGGDGENHPQYKGPSSGVEKYALADVEVVRESDFGANDESFRCVSHLGHLLHPGDTVLGYDLTSELLVAVEDAVSANAAVGGAGGGLRTSYVVPDVVLVKKVTDRRREKEHLPTQVDDHDDDDDAGGRGGDGKKRISKKKQRRQRRKEGKRRRALEEGAARMGVLDDEEEEEGAEQDGEQFADVEDEEEGDPALLEAELEALEREFSALGRDGAGDDHQQPQGESQQD